VFKGHQVARRDKRACLFAGMIFTLPLHLQVLFGYGLARLLAIVGPVLLAGDPLVELLELLFGFAILAWVRDGVAVAVGVEGVQPPSNAGLLAGGSMVYVPFGIHAELHIIAIGPTDKADALELPVRNCLE